ncbi:unnamed protein product [Callosobruchus maculatus]|uniref:Uncharacterized protein n=1 Tax=Callosobruchus maculatus TaxID=64391 RepID=A0A653DHL0_CALMS|nr:unnamed protein product [Callosobruchus maculatus]
MYQACFLRVLASQKRGKAAIQLYGVTLPHGSV